MSKQVIIDGITGKSPYHVYICQGDGINCFYINTINSTPYNFLIPPLYSDLESYMVKIIDANNFITVSTV